MCSLTQMASWRLFAGCFVRSPLRLRLDGANPSTHA
jgi:hypothetical protein